jgi:glyoxylase I family protein
MPRALTFYRDLLGFTVVSASPEVETAEGRFSHWMWLRFGRAEIMLNTQYDSNERPTQPPEVRSKDTVFYIGCSDIELAYQELTDRGLKAERPKLAPYGLKLFSVEDPDCYMIVFQEVR